MPANRLSPRFLSLLNDGPVGGSRLVGDGLIGLESCAFVPLGPTGVGGNTADKG